MFQHNKLKIMEVAATKVVYFNCNNKVIQQPLLTKTLVVARLHQLVA